MSSSTFSDPALDLDPRPPLSPQLLQVIGAVEDRLEQLRRPHRRGAELAGLFGRAGQHGPQPAHEAQEGADTGHGLARDAGFPGVSQRLGERHPLFRRPRAQAGDARFTDAPAGDVEDPL